jgi:hypothetical protein
VRLKRHFSADRHACSPDQYARAMGGEPEPVMHAWVRATALADLVASLERGRLPQMTYDVAAPYPVEQLWGDDAITYLASELKDSIDQARPRPVPTAEDDPFLTEAF